MTLSNEISSALEAEVAAIVDVLMEVFADPEAADDSAMIAEGLRRYQGHVERFGALAEEGGLLGLREVCVHFQERLAQLTAAPEPLWGDDYRESLEEWPALIMGYLESIADPMASEILIEHLQNPCWSAPLPESVVADLRTALLNPQLLAPAATADTMVETAVATASTIMDEAMVVESVTAPSAVQEVNDEEALAVSDLHEEAAVESAPEDDPLASAVGTVVAPDQWIAQEEAALPTEVAISAPIEPEVVASTADTDDLLDLNVTLVDDLASNVAGEMEATAAAASPTLDAVESPLATDALETAVDHSASDVASEMEATAATVSPILDEVEEPPATDALETAVDLSTSDVASEMEATAATVSPILDEVEEPPATDALETAADLPGFDQELVGLLEAEAGAIAETLEEIAAVVLSPEAEAEARSDMLLSLAEQIARLSDAAEALGLSGLQQTCAHLNGNVMAFAGMARSLTEDEYRFIAEWPARAVDYLQTLPNRATSQALIADFQEAVWPNPLSAEEAADLADLLATPTFAIPEAMAVEPRPQEALPEHVSLALPGDVNPELLDSLLQELPGQTAELSSAIQRLVAGNGVLHDVEVAQRIAHTVKGAGNTVGVRGIANLTHHMEDILQAFSKHQTLPGRHLAETLMSAADCLESMSEALVGLGEPPPQAREVLQSVLDWANQIDQRGLPDEDVTPPQQVTAKPEMAREAETAAEAAGMAATAAAQAAVPMLRVPATLVDELLRLVGESIILTGQVQERTRKALRQIRAVQTQHQVFQQLTADLEQLVEIRGVAQFHDQLAGTGNFDPLELEQYNELNTVTHRLLEASADSRALGQDIRGDLNDLDDLLIMQGRLHRESQEAVLRTRMVPVKSIVPRLQRSVRQTCRLTDKEVNFVVSGEATLMDSNLLADITDPLMHVLRNAIDHGIELPDYRQILGKNPVGQVELSFLREGDTIVVRCQDDGAGLDFATIRRVAQERGFIGPEAIPSEAELTQLILASGFSTRAEATQTSGRGVGLDAVYTRLRELKGTFQIRSSAGQGCLMEFRLPVTLIAVHALLVRARDRRFAISSRGIEQVLYSGLGETYNLGEKTVYRMGDAFYEISTLEALLQLAEDRRSADRQTPALLLVRDTTGIVRAVMVQEVMDSRDLVVKPLGRYFPRLRGIVGATILGDGSVVPVLDLPELLSIPLISMMTTARRETRAAAETQPRRRLALVVDDSLSARRALAQAVEDVGFEVRTARDGLEAVSMIEARRPDLLLVDLEMPRMNGLELTAHVRGREATRHLPVIMVTSRSTAKHRREAESMGVDFYMTKPFTDDELMENIQQAMKADTAVSG